MRIKNKLLKSVVSLICVPLLFQSGVANADTLVIDPDQVRWANGQDANVSAGSYFQISGTQSGWFEFTIPSAEPLGLINSATLNITTRTGHANGDRITNLGVVELNPALDLTTLLKADSQVGSNELASAFTTTGTHSTNVAIDIKDILDFGGTYKLELTRASAGTDGSVQLDGLTAGTAPTLVIEYTPGVVPAGTALLTPSHILMVAKGGNTASDGGKEQTFTLSNSATTTSAVVYTSATTTFTTTAAPFSLDDSDCTGKTLYNGQSCEITLLLDPDAGLDADKAGLVKVTTDVGTSVAYVSQFESLAEQAERRIPPVAYASSIKFSSVEVDRSTDLAPGSYNMRFDLEGYFSDYNVWVAIYDCTPAQISDESCGTGTPLVSKELTQTVLSGSTNYTGKSTFNVATAVSYTIPSTSKIASQKHKFVKSFTIPAYDEVGTSLIARLFYREGVDADAGNRAVSIIFSGAHLHEGGIDALGRKIIISQ